MAAAYSGSEPPGIIYRVALGKRYSGKDHTGQGFRELLTEFVSLLGAFNVGDFILSLAWVDRLSGFHARLEKNFQQLDRFLDMVVEEHLHPCTETGDCNEDDNKDFVHVLLSLLAESDADGFTLDRESIKALILDMFLAGTDTASTTVEWAMAELVSHPAAMKKVQDEVRGVVGEKTQQVCEDDLEQLSYLKSVVKEVLRLHPPAPLLAPRESLTGVLLGSYEIPAKARVIINAWAIARDPALWERLEEFWSEEFCPDRRPEISPRDSCPDPRPEQLAPIPIHNSIFLRIQIGFSDPIDPLTPLDRCIESKISLVVCLRYANGYHHLHV